MTNPANAMAVIPKSTLTVIFILMFYSRITNNIPDYTGLSLQSNLFSSRVLTYYRLLLKDKYNLAVVNAQSLNLFLIKMLSFMLQKLRHLINHE